MINCKAYAEEILNGITGHGHLAVISVGNDPASLSYVKGKEKDCARVGFGFEHHMLPDGVDKTVIVDLINELNNDDDVTGIIVQLPFPAGYDEDEITRCVVREKDVDGFRPDSPFRPCTPEGILYLLQRELGDLTGKHAVVIGRGKLVGKPLMQMLLDEDMYVTVCHSKTPYYRIQEMAYTANAVIVAAGVPNHFYFRHIRPSAVVIDCGVHRMADGKLCGDVEYTNTKRCTPVPGGVGLLTRAMLMRHVERKD